MLALDRVGKTYPNGVHALERFSADIKPGEIVAIIGATIPRMPIMRNGEGPSS